jgi:hypothetical protein
LVQWMPVHLPAGRVGAGLGVGDADGVADDACVGLTDRAGVGDTVDGFAAVRRGLRLTAAEHPANAKATVSARTIAGRWTGARVILVPNVTPRCERWLETTSHPFG